MRTRRLVLSIGWAAALVAGCGGPETGIAPPAEAPIRERALAVIERIERDRAAPHGTLRRLLADPDPVVRARAALALGRTGDREARLALTTRLDDNEPRVRAMAAVAISLARDGRFVPELLRLARDRDPRARAAAITALGNLRAARGFDAIVGALADHDTGVACAAADACFRLCDARAIAPLGTALRDPRPRVRYHAANALAYVQATRPDPLTGVAPPVERDIAAAITALVPLLIDTLGDADIDVRVAAFDALRRRGAPAETGEAVRRALAGEAVEPAVAAARFAATQPDARFTDALVGALAHEHAWVRWAAADAIAGTAAAVDPTARDGVLAALRDRLARDREATVRGAALEAIVAVDAGAIDTLDRHATDADPRVRAAYYRAAGRAGGASAASRLHEGLGDAAPLVRIAALDGWAAADGVDGVTARLARALRDPVSGVRAHAAECLAEHGDATAIPALERASAEAARRRDLPTAEARLAILAALARLGGESARARLEAALDDPSALVRHGATARLGALDGGSPDVDYRGAAPTPPTPETPVGSMPEIVLELPRGTVRLRLDRAIAPVHVDAFCALVDRGFYDGLPMHRVVPNHVVQGGDPEGTGYGSAAFALADEHSATPFRAGTVGMAKLGPDTGSCQFFVCVVPRPHLEQRYTAFGRVVEGMQVVGRTMPGDRIVRARRAPVTETPGTDRDEVPEETPQVTGN